MPQLADDARISAVGDLPHLHGRMHAKAFIADLERTGGRADHQQVSDAAGTGFHHYRQRETIARIYIATCQARRVWRCLESGDIIRLRQFSRAGEAA